MAKLTREQYNKFNAACKNGFKMDLQYFGIWGEKRCIKTLRLPNDENLYDVTLEFRDKTENYRKIGVIPEIRIVKLIPASTEGMYRVIGLKEQEIGSLVNRRSMKVLQGLTDNYTDEILTDMIKSLIA